VSWLKNVAGWLGAASPASASPVGAGPVQAFTAYNLDDPALIEFLSGGFRSSTGISVNDRAALRNSTFFRSVNLIAGAIGMLPLHLMEQDEDGGNKRKAREHPLFRILHKAPNRYQTAAEFKSYMQTCALLDGNAYAMVIRVGSKISQIVPLPRKSVTPELTDTFDIRFKYQRPKGGTVYLSSREVFHFRHPVTLDGLRGVSLLEVAKETLGIATIAQRAAGKLFSNGSFAAGVLETDKTLGDDVHQRIRDDWEEIYSGADNAGKWAILEQGLKAKQLSQNAKESQHVETREHESEEVSRFTGVPRPLLMFDETSWGSGIEQLGQFLVTYCLMIWFVAWEQAVERILDDDERDRLYAKFNDGALLRGSLKDQAEFFAKALGAGGGHGWLKANEVREAFDRNPEPGGEVLPQPTAAPRGAVAAGEVEEDPAAPPAVNTGRRRDRSEEEEE